MIENFVIHNMIGMEQQYLTERIQEGGATAIKGTCGKTMIFPMWIKSGTAFSEKTHMKMKGLDLRCVKHVKRLYLMLPCWFRLFSVSSLYVFVFKDGSLGCQEKHMFVSRGSRDLWQQNSSSSKLGFDIHSVCP